MDGWMESGLGGLGPTRIMKNKIIKLLRVTPVSDSGVKSEVCRLPLTQTHTSLSVECSSSSAALLVAASRPVPAPVVSAFQHDDAIIATHLNSSNMV